MPSGSNSSEGKGAGNGINTSLRGTLHLEEVDDRYTNFPSSVVISFTEGPEAGHAQQQDLSSTTESQASSSTTSQTSTRRYLKWDRRPPDRYWTDMTLFWVSVSFNVFMVTDVWTLSGRECGIPVIHYLCIMQYCLSMCSLYMLFYVVNTE